MFKIGDFSRLTRVTVKALRYYDGVGLLRPARVDRETGYRYYSADQLPRLHRVLALKDLGFSLEQIALLLDDAMPVEQLRGMLRRKQEELQRQVAEEQARLKRVATRLLALEEGDGMKYEIMLKSVEPLRVASLRAVVPTYADVSALFGELCSFIARHRVPFTGPALTVYHDGEYREQDVDLEVAVPVEGEAPAHERIGMRELPAIPQAATLIHQGPYELLHEAYAALMRWVEVNRYQIAGLNREVYLRGPESGGDPADYITEIQLPLSKAKEDIPCKLSI
jgi:effector-binding domain-containing protein